MLEVLNSANNWLSKGPECGIPQPRPPLHTHLQSSTEPPGSSSPAVAQHAGGCPVSSCFTRWLRAERSMPHFQTALSWLSPQLSARLLAADGRSCCRASVFPMRATPLPTDGRGRSAVRSGRPNGAARLGERCLVLLRSHQAAEQAHTIKSCLRTTQVIASASNASTKKQVRLWAGG